MRTCRLGDVSRSDRVECDLVHIQIEFFLRRTRLVILRQRFGRMGKLTLEEQLVIKRHVPQRRPMPATKFRPARRSGADRPRRMIVALS
jgi:hypothetical protein